MDMNCPKCNTEYKCPCRPCVERLGPSSWVTFDDDTMACPCGLRLHGNEWFEEELRQYQQAKEPSRVRKDLERFMEAIKTTPLHNPDNT
jgi:hypothetical protein